MLKRSQMYSAELGDVHFKKILLFSHMMKDPLLKDLSSRGILYFSNEEDYILWNIKYGL